MSDPFAPLLDGEIESPAETALRVKVNELVAIVNILANALNSEDHLRIDYVTLLRQRNADAD